VLSFVSERLCRWRVGGVRGGCRMPVIGPQTHVERVSEAGIGVGCREPPNGPCRPVGASFWPSGCLRVLEVARQRGAPFFEFFEEQKGRRDKRARSGAPHTAAGTLLPPARRWRMSDRCWGRAGVAPTRGHRRDSQPVVGRCPKVPPTWWRSTAGEADRTALRQPLAWVPSEPAPCEPLVACRGGLPLRQGCR